MEKQQVIPAEDCCIHYNIEFSFIRSLEQHGLLSIANINEKAFIASDDLGNLEKFIQLHYQLEVNLEGIEVINHLLDRISSMQQAVKELKNKLSVYER